MPTITFCLPKRADLLEPEFQVVGIVPDGRALVQTVLELRPDVVLLDISMPELNGLDAGEQVKRKNRAIKLIYITQTIGPDVAAEAFQARSVWLFG